MLTVTGLYFEKTQQPEQTTVFYPTISRNLKMNRPLFGNCHIEGYSITNHISGALLIFEKTARFEVHLIVFKYGTWTNPDRQA